jgi:hypothetical protein
MVEWSPNNLEALERLYEAKEGMNGKAGSGTAQVEVPHENRDVPDAGTTGTPEDERKGEISGQQPHPSNRPESSKLEVTNNNKSNIGQIHGMDLGQRQEEVQIFVGPASLVDQMEAGNNEKRHQSQEPSSSTQNREGTNDPLLAPAETEPPSHGNHSSAPADHRDEPFASFIGRSVPWRVRQPATSPASQRQEHRNLGRRWLMASPGA